MNSLKISIAILAVLMMIPHQYSSGFVITHTIGKLEFRLICSGNLLGPCKNLFINSVAKYADDNQVDLGAEINMDQMSVDDENYACDHDNFGVVIHDRVRIIL